MPHQAAHATHPKITVDYSNETDAKTAGRGLQTGPIGSRTERRNGFGNVRRL